MNIWVRLVHGGDVEEQRRGDDGCGGGDGGGAVEEEELWRRWEEGHVCQLFHSASYQI
ncbi:hypothetical protein Hanom_Chr12g01152511 [Helianthus anomalus]